MPDSGTPMHRSVRSYGSSDDGTLSRPDSFIIDPPHRVTTNPKTITSQWYLAYYIPAIDWIRNYSWTAFPGDLCSGVTLASFQIPVSLSYATSLAGVDAASGLWGLIIAPLVYALLGSVPVMVVAPEGPISLILGKLVPPYFSDPVGHKHGRSELDNAQIGSLVAGTAGALVLFLGLSRLGFLTRLLAQSLLRGFITGVGLVMLSDQLPAMLGMSSAMHNEIGMDASSFAKAKYTWNHWREDARPLESKFSFFALAALIVFKLFKKALVRRGYKRAVLIPDILTVVSVSTVVCWLGNYVDEGLKVVGDVSVEGTELIWMLRPKYFNDFKINFQSGFYIGILGLLESTVAARLLGSSGGGGAPSSEEDETGMRSANRELVALGAANVAGSLFGALPSFGGYGRSKINMLSGGTTQMSAVISALVTLVCTYKLTALVYYLPRCTLSGVIASIGLSLLEEAPHEIKFFWRVRSFSDIATMLLALLTTFFWSVEAGVTVGAASAVVRILHHATIPRIQLLVRDPQTEHFVNADDCCCSEDLLHNSGTLVVKIPEPLTFANSVILEDRLKRLELHGTTKVHPGQPRSRQGRLNTVIFHLKGMTTLDASAATILQAIVNGYLSRGIRVVFTELVTRREVREMLDRSGILEMVERQPWDRNCFTTVKEAFEFLNNRQPNYRLTGSTEEEPELPSAPSQTQ